MRHSVIICTFLALATLLQAQDSTLLISTPIFADSALTTSLPLSYPQVDSLPLDCELPIFFDEALAYLDTTECTSDTIIAELPDSIYKQRLQALPFIIEVPYNEVVRRYILRYVKHSPRQLASLQRKAQYYFPIFEDILAKHQLPFELCYLPVIESALNPQAHSPVGAAGLWQFMPATGKKYGLEINSLIDERMDPILSTEAACRFLKALYNVFGDWNLVIAAYNCGPGNVAKAIRIANGKRNFWEIYPYLPRETRSYVPLFIAANYIMNFYQEHNMCPATPLFNYATDTVMISDRVHLQQIAEKMNIPLAELQFLNPQYRYDIIPGNIKPYPLVVPFEHINSYALNRDSILAYKPELAKREIKLEPSEGEIVYYKVKNGDTLGGIAKKYRVSVKNLQKWNKLKSTTIRVGQKLKIYK